MSDIVIGDRYVLHNCLGKGSFGKIYKLRDTVTGLDVAGKLEHNTCKHPQLVYEHKVYDILRGHTNIPYIHQLLQEGEYSVLVMDMLGPNLEDLLARQLDHRFSLKTVLMLAIQMINVIQHMHNKDFIHRDIKPENFLMGTVSTSSVVYLVDMGLAKRYRQGDSHIGMKTNKPLIGTVRYASIDTHRGHEQCRKDDMESLGYVLVYLLKGELPWQNVRAESTEEKYKRIYRMKADTTHDVLCADMPHPFVEYFDMCARTTFDDAPDYERMRALFVGMMEDNGFEYDSVYDWA
jgi:serine/threonine protein kinase